MLSLGELVNEHQLSALSVVGGYEDVGADGPLLRLFLRVETDAVPRLAHVAHHVEHLAMRHYYGKRFVFQTSLS